jgi:hypothetical protein
MFSPKLILAFGYVIILLITYVNIPFTNSDFKYK